ETEEFQMRGYLSWNEWVKARGVSIPVLKRRAGGDLEMIVAHRAHDIALHHVATAFAAPVAVHESYFPAVIKSIRRRRHHFRRIFCVGTEIPRSRVGCSGSSVHWHGPESVEGR